MKVHDDAFYAISGADAGFTLLYYCLCMLMPCYFSPLYKRCLAHELTEMVIRFMLILRGRDTCRLYICRAGHAGHRAEVFYIDKKITYGASPRRRRPLPEMARRR